MSFLQFAVLSSALLALSCSSNAGDLSLGSEKDSLAADFRGDSYKLTHTFRGKDDRVLGEVYAKHITDDIFSSLVIKKDDKILYQVDRTEFISEDGVDAKVYADDFYGYKIVIKRDDYIVLSYLRNGGESVSDDMTIEWQYDKKKFKLMLTP